MKVSVQHFGELSGTIVFMALHDGYNSQRIDVVLDNYKEIFFKAAEKVRRGKDNYQLSGQISGGQKIHWRDKIITRKKSQICVIKFPSNSWLTNPTNFQGER